MSELITPKLQISAGKWWVWKSTTSAAKSLYLAMNWQKTLAIDMDWWKALSRVFWIENWQPNNIHFTWIDNLWFAPIQSADFLKRRRELENFETYISQYPEDYWLVAFNDMLNEFFGACTDVISLYKFISLVKILDQAKKNWFTNIIIDIEPTSWFERLINWVEAVSRSIENLSWIWFIKLQALWAAWPDIAAFLKSTYIKNATEYWKKLLDTRAMLLWSSFSVVSIPEPEPLEQAFNDVIPLIQKIWWNLSDLLLNNCWRPDNLEVEEKIASLAEGKASQLWINVKYIPHDKDMFWTDRKKILNIIGWLISW